jgi:hypothetical protein
MRELVVHYSSEEEHRRHDHSGDQGDQEAVLNRRRALFVAVGASTA